MISSNSRPPSDQSKADKLKLSQLNELEAVFSAMREGVLLISFDSKVVKINKAACQMMGVGSDSQGKSISEVVRNSELKSYVAMALTNPEPEEIELELHEPREMIVQVYSRVTEGRNHKEKGLIVVLNDITQLKQLEKIRKDFVANVSHELKTPVTSIQGFVETLLDGAMHNPADNQRFLEIIHRQTKRLNYIFNDLLILAGLEKDSIARSISLEKCDLNALCESVRQVCALKGEKKRISIETALEVQTVKANSSLLEQAVANLVDNAIKYSLEERKILISSNRIEGGMVKISVTDSGQGIAETHLPRLFERFYRVDQSRSRSEEGGTGLGLAIVKHIALLHQGRVEVQSVIGKGSVFSIFIPE